MRWTGKLRCSKRSVLRSSDAGGEAAWGFFTNDVSLFRFRGSRASSVAKEVFGTGKHKGTLIVDRYSGYTAAWRGRLQDCYEHLKRDGLKRLRRSIWAIEHLSI